jgi:hypothetical protein
MALIHQWKFEGSNIESISGATAATGNATFPTTNKISGSRSVYFGGNSNSYYNGSSVSLISRTVFSIAHWVNGPSQQGKNTFSAFGGTYRNFSIGNNDTGNLNLAWFTGTTTNCISAPCLDNTWHHYCVTWDNGVVTNYVDGKYVNSESKTPPSFSGYTAAGYSLGYFYPFAGSSYFTGYMDDLRIYDTVLSTVEVQQLYNSYFTEKAVNFMSTLV